MPDNAAASFGVGGAALLVDLVLIPLILRLSNATPVFVHVVAAFGAEAAAVITGRIAVASFSFWAATSVLSFGAIAHLFVFSAVYKSVSLRMLVFLAGSRSGMSDIESLVMAIGRPTIAARIALLCEMQLVEGRIDGKFSVTPSGRRTAERLRAVQHLLGVAQSGLYRQDKP